MKVKIYVEGGGDAQALRTRCRRGFSSFFQRAGLSGRMPAIVACGPRNDAYDSYCTALASAGQDDFPMLLVDSEAAVSHARAWDHLKARDNWDRPPSAHDEHAQLMVQCMEAWFLADRALLAKFFDQGFTDKPLPGSQNVEEVPKQEVFQALKMATRHSRKGEYDKGKHSFDILAQLEPDRVKEASNHAKELLETLDQRSGR